LHSLSPAEYHRQKLPIAWNPDAGEPDAVDDFLHDIVKPRDVPTLYRLIAHTLYKEYIGEKAAILIGGGQNGKSVFLDVIERFIGKWNVTHRELQDFDDDGFAANNLEGKLANLATEIGEQTLSETKTFKKLTGRDTLDAPVKFEKPIQFENFASLMFATNEMPVFGQDNQAVWRRWVYVDFPYTFDDEDPNAKDPVPKQQLMDELTQESQFEALLVRCQQEIQRWHENDGQFFADAMPKQEVREKMKKAAEPIYNFATTCLQPTDDGGFVEKSRVRACYRAYADEEDLPVVAENTFGERLLSIRDLTIETGQKQVKTNGNASTRVWNSPNAVVKFSVSTKTTTISRHRSTASSRPPRPSCLSCGRWSSRTTISQCHARGLCGGRPVPSAKPPPAEPSTTSPSEGGSWTVRTVSFRPSKQTTSFCCFSPPSSVSQTGTNR